VAVSNSADGVD
jgi:hypothetical protein